MEAAVQKAVDELSSLAARLSSPEVPCSGSPEQLFELLGELELQGPEAVEAFCRAAVGPAAVLAGFSLPPPTDHESACSQLQQVFSGGYAASNLLTLLCDRALCGRLGSSLTYRLAACSR